MVASEQTMEKGGGQPFWLADSRVPAFVSGKDLERERYPPEPCFLLCLPGWAADVIMSVF